MALIQYWYTVTVGIAIQLNELARENKHPEGHRSCAFQLVQTYRANERCQLIRTYSDVIVDELRPSKHVHESIH